MNSTTAAVTTLRIGSGQTEIIFLAGREIGDVTTGDTSALAYPKGARGAYKFTNRDDAIAACISYATRGYWENEI